MANDLDDVVKITLTNESQAVATESFQIPAILASFTNFQERTRTYNNITEVGEDFKSTDKVYVMATKLFGQSTVIGAVPPSIVVGKRQVDTVTLTPTVLNNSTYTVTIDGIPLSFTSDSSATLAEINAGIDAAIGSPSGISASVVGGTVVVTTNTPGTLWSITTSSNISAVNTASSEDIVDALEQMEQENDTWYLVETDSHIPAEVSALSDAIQARRKIFGTSSQDSVATTTGTTDIGSVLSAKSAGRTFGVYSPTADTEYPEAVWAGSQLAVTPGSNDWDFKQGVGATVTKLSSTAKTNLKNKNWNYYTAKGGVNIFQNGNMFDGNPIDIVIGEDWLYARLQEGIYFRIINSLKIPMTNPGLLIVENEIRSVLSLAETNGLIDSGWTVSTPTVLSISTNDRANRVARTFRFTCRLQGSVRSVEIIGKISV